MKKILKIAIGIALVYSFIFAGSMLYMAYVAQGSTPASLPPLPQISPPTRSPQAADPPPTKASRLQPPPHTTNFVLLGVDHNNLADTIIVGSFNREAKTINLLSIPRDLRTEIAPNRLAQMQDKGINPPSPLKINAMRAFGGRTHGAPFLTAQLEDILNITIDYYIEMRLEGFREIVDAIGGITMEIMSDLAYNDPCQDLYINIPAGVHHMDGHMAEGFVRYRQFPTGDLGRNQMQLAFMQAIISQVLSTESLTNNPIGLINAVFGNINTNGSIIDMAKYLPYIAKDVQISTFPLPGEGKYMGGISWFVADMEKIPPLVTEIFGEM